MKPMWTPNYQVCIYILPEPNLYILGQNTVLLIPTTKHDSYQLEIFTLVWWGLRLLFRWSNRQRRYWCLMFSKIITLVYTIWPLVQTVWADIAFVFLFRPIGKSSRISATFPQSRRNLVGRCVGKATNLRVETPRLGRGRTRDGGNNSVKVICSCCRQGPKARQSWGSHGRVNICEPDKSINCGSTVFGAPHPLAPTADKNAKLTLMPSRPTPRHIPSLL